MSLGRPKRLNCFRHRANVRRRRPAAPPQNAHPERRGFPGKQREIFRRRFGIHDAVDATKTGKGSFVSFPGPVDKKLSTHPRNGSGQTNTYLHDSLLKIVLP